MALSAAYTQPCESNTGGGLRLHIANKDDVASFTLLGEDYSAIVMEAGKVFFKYEFEQESIVALSELTRENNTAMYENTIEWLMSKITSTQRKSVQDIVDASLCGVIAIIEDTNNVKQVFGYSEPFLKEFPLKISGDTTTTGQALGDANGSTVTLLAKSTDRPRILLNSVTIPV